MSKNKKCIIIISLILLASTATVFGQSNRTYVAESGSDANSCSIILPCRTIVHALAAVNAGGEVVIVENGEYDQFFVDKSVTVGAAPGINAGIITTGGYGIIVVGAQATDTVTFRNLSLKGPGAQVISSGITNLSAGTMFIDNCVLTNFSNAVNWSNVAGQIFVHDTTIRHCLFGIGLSAPTEGVVRATIDNCKVEMNDTGITINSKVTATIRNTIASNNSSRAVLIRSATANLRAEATIDNCEFNSNTVGLLMSSGSGVSVARLTRTTINNNTLSGVSVAAPNIVYSLQNNTISGNFPDVNGNLTPLTVK
jgi:hypothetical protein